MSKTRKNYLIILFITWVSLVMPISHVYAEGLLPSVSLSSSNGISEVIAEVNDKSSEIIDTWEYLGYTVRSTGGVVVTVDTFGFNDLDKSVKKELMEYTLEAIQGSSLTRIDKTKLYNFICDTDTDISKTIRQLTQDTTSDFYTAYSWISPLTSKLGLVLAVVALVLFFLIGLTLIIDIAFVTNPLVSYFMTGGTKERRPWIVSREAFSVWVETETGSNKKDVFFEYAKRKWWHFILVGMCILFLARGLLWSIYGDLLSMFEAMFGG